MNQSQLNERTGKRCGHDAMDHEDLGRWCEGEPMLLDEKGEGWRFVNGVDGIRKERVK